MIEIISFSAIVFVLALKIVHELGKSIRIKQLSKLSADEIDAITKLETALRCERKKVGVMKKNNGKKQEKQSR